MHSVVFLIWLFAIGLAVTSAILPWMFLYGLMFIQRRKHTLLNKRHGSLSLHQLFFLLFCQFYILVDCMIKSFYLLSNSHDSSYFKFISSPWFQFGMHYCWELGTLGVLYTSFLKYFHLWYDLNYTMACVTHEWYKIIQNHSEAEISANNGNTTPSISHSSYSMNKAKKQQKKRKKRRDLELAARKCTNTEMNIKPNKPKLEQNDSIIFNDCDNAPSTLNLLANANNRFKIRDEWFIVNKTSLGAAKITVLLSYCVIIFVPLFVVWFGNNAIKSYVVYLAIIGSFYLIPIASFAYFHFEMSRTMIYDDKYKINKELKYFCRIIIISETILFIFKVIRVIISFISFDSNTNVINCSIYQTKIGLIYYGSVYSSATVIYFFISLFVTKWVLDCVTPGMIVMLVFFWL